MKNKGFTLVEVIVALTVTMVLSASVISLIILTINQSKGIKTESQVQVEGQVISDYVKSLIQGCNKYSFKSDDEGAFLIIYTRKHEAFEPVDLGGGKYDTSPKLWWYYMYFDYETGYVYITDRENQLDDSDLVSDIFTEKDENGNTVILDDTYLGQYVKSFNITPASYNSKNVAEDFDYNVKLEFLVQGLNYEQELNKIFKIKSR